MLAKAGGLAGAAAVLGVVLLLAEALQMSITSRKNAAMTTMIRLQGRGCACLMMFLGLVDDLAVLRNLL